MPSVRRATRWLFVLAAVATGCDGSLPAPCADANDAACAAVR